MTFQKRPAVSNRAIDRAGDVLIDNSSTEEAVSAARDILNTWRACHAYPINTFQSTLRSKISSGFFGDRDDIIIAQRLKRAPTILRKLREMKPFDVTLLKMQDIAGIRAILPTISAVRKLEQDYKNNKSLPHILHNSKDYIQFPKEKDGYRSIHLIYKYKNKKRTDWDGLLLELQIRTSLQHSWATAVETMHSFLGKAIKTRQGQTSDQKWTSFFSFVSSAFACMEKSPVVPAHKEMSQNFILNEIRNYEKELKVIEKLNALPVALTMIYKGDKNSHFHLIILDTAEKKVSVASYGREQFTEANNEYARLEKEFENKEEKEVVLVSATKGALEGAYSSFFANTNDFANNLKYVLSGEWVEKGL